uniref:Uncharacterized protein n=1 Tax=Molossus molossus TaxID=27622 RepID=A0A7J8FAQ9_MOLMO|nr:hypothetical protein HJG59_008594 [Molossus molossus]
MKTRRSLSQLASQSPARALPPRPPAPDPHDGPQSAAADTRHRPPPLTPADVGDGLSAAVGACAFPAAFAPPASGQTGGGKEAIVGDSFATSSSVLLGKQLLTTAQDSVLRTTTVTSLRLEGRRLPILALGSSPLTVKESRERLLNAHHRSAELRVGT